MGIDVYLEWDGMTEEEEEAQYTGFDIFSGNVGYLREAYHGEPYATAELIQEDWERQPEGGFRIPNAVLVERLPEVMGASRLRAKQLYKADKAEQERSAKSFSDFVALHGIKEREGKNPRIIVSY